MNIKTIINEEIKKVLITERRNSLLKYLQQKLPNVPQHVLNDLFYNMLKSSNIEEINDTISEYKDMKWMLKKNFPINYNMFDEDTINRLKAREGGTKNPNQVPNDTERHQKQKELITKNGLPKEPIILHKTNNNKYELWEGWHRTIQLLNIYPNGYDYPNVYIGYK